jgi:hypothetical protein
VVVVVVVVVVLTVNGNQVSSMIGVEKADTTDKILRCASNDTAYASLFADSNQSLRYLGFRF